MKQPPGRRGITLGIIFMELLPAALLCALFAGVGIIHVTSRVMVVNVGYKLSDLEQEGRTLTRERDRLKLELATLKSPARLERLAREKLGMGPAAAGLVIPVSYSPAKPGPASVQSLGFIDRPVASQSPAPSGKGG